MQELQVFQNSQFGNLEILTIEGKEWFPAIKVAETLGYTNPRKAIRDHAKEKGGNDSFRPFKWWKSKQKVHR